MTRRRTISLSLASLAGLSAILISGAALAVGVPMDQVRMITLGKPFKAVYIGNPIIADITVVDATHVFVLGKNFGTTNLVALDENGRQILNQEITVSGQEGTMVTLQRGQQKFTLACPAGRCESKPTPGDETKPYDDVSGQIDKREIQNVKAAATGQ